MSKAKYVHSRADVRDADDWWGSVSDAQRVSYHRWLTGLSKEPPKPDEDQMSLLDELDEVPDLVVEAGEAEGAE